MSERDPRSLTASRRNILLTAGGAAMVLALPGAVAGKPRATLPAPHRGPKPPPMVVAKDGAKLFYKDWGTGQPIVFSHGWPLDADAWDNQMLFLVQHGFRVIAHDRRSHGRSEQTSNGNDMDTYADDLGAVIETLDLKNAMLVGHSTGGGEVARYLARHGSSRVAKAVMIGAVAPLMVKTARNPGGQDITIFDGLRANLAADRSQLYKDLAVPFYGFNRPGVKPSQAIIDAFWLQGMTGGIKGQYECIKAFSETDFTEDLMKMDVPTLLLHGDVDQIVPFADSSKLSAQLVKKSTLKVYEGAPHGLCTTEAAKVNADLLAFIKS